MVSMTSGRCRTPQTASHCIIDLVSLSSLRAQHAQALPQEGVGRSDNFFAASSAISAGRGTTTPTASSPRHHGFCQHERPARPARTASRPGRWARRLRQLPRDVVDLVGVRCLRARRGQHASGRGPGGRAVLRAGGGTNASFSEVLCLPSVLSMALW